MGAAAERKGGMVGRRKQINPPAGCAGSSLYAREFFGFSSAKKQIRPPSEAKFGKRHKAADLKPTYILPLFFSHEKALIAKTAGNRVISGGMGRYA